MTKTYSIYGLIDPRDNKVFYIGKSSRSPDERYEEHIKETSGETPKQKKMQEIYKSKMLPPDLVILEVGIKGSKLAFTREVSWMEIFRITGTVLTNASIDYDGVYFLTDNHLGTGSADRKVGCWSVDITEQQLGDFESIEVNLADDFKSAEVNLAGKFESTEVNLSGDEIECQQMQFKSEGSIVSDDSVRLRHQVECLFAKKNIVIGEVMKRLESGRWKGEYAALVANKLKEHFEENGGWLPKFEGSNKLKKKKHARTLKIMGFLRSHEE